MNLAFGPFLCFLYCQLVSDVRCSDKRSTVMHCQVEYSCNCAGSTWLHKACAVQVCGRPVISQVAAHTYDVRVQGPHQVVGVVNCICQMHCEHGTIAIRLVGAFFVTADLLGNLDLQAWVAVLHGQHCCAKQYNLPGHFVNSAFRLSMLMYAAYVAMLLKPFNLCRAKHSSAWCLHDVPHSVNTSILCMIAKPWQARLGICSMGRQRQLASDACQGFRHRYCLFLLRQECCCCCFTGIPNAQGVLSQGGRARENNSRQRPPTYRMYCVYMRASSRLESSKKYCKTCTSSAPASAAQSVLTWVVFSVLNTIQSDSLILMCSSTM